MTKHESRCIVVTGASRGIGAACASVLLNDGHNVIGLSRSRGDMPAEALHVAVDLSDLDAATKAMHAVMQNHPVDALVCNAGRGDLASLENFSATQIEASISFNLVSPLILVRTALPALKREPRSDIIFIGSESALKGGRFGSLYSAAKFGLRGAAQALRAECASANCHVGIVQPGMVRTGFFDELSFEPGPEPAHALDAGTVAGAVLNMLSAPDEAVIEEITVNPRQHVLSRKTAKSGLIMTKP